MRKPNSKRRCQPTSIHTTYKWLFVCMEIVFTVEQHEHLSVSIACRLLLVRLQVQSAAHKCWTTSAHQCGRQCMCAVCIILSLLSLLFDFTFNTILLEQRTDRDEYRARCRPSFRFRSPYAVRARQCTCLGTSLTFYRRILVWLDFTSYIWVCIFVSALRTYHLFILVQRIVLLFFIVCAQCKALGRFSSSRQLKPIYILAVIYTLSFAVI